MIISFDVTVDVFSAGGGGPAETGNLVGGADKRHSFENVESVENPYRKEIPVLIKSCSGTQITQLTCLRNARSSCPRIPDQYAAKGHN